MIDFQDADSAAMGVTKITDVSTIPLNHTSMDKCGCCCDEAAWQSYKHSVYMYSSSVMEPGCTQKKFIPSWRETVTTTRIMGSLMSPTE